MSLINDALKRATQTQPATPPPAETSAPMQPAIPPHPGGLPAYFLPVLLLTLSLSCWFLVKAWNSGQSGQKSLALVAPPTAVAAREVQPASPTSLVPPAVAPVSAPPSTNATPDPVPAPAPTLASQSLKPAAPAYKLQAIFYRPARPSAVVNAKTVFVGDKVGAAKVRAITPEGVTLEIDGRSEVLTLP